MDDLDPAVDDELEPHPEPVNVEKNYCNAESKQVCADEKIVNVVLVQPNGLIVRDTWVDLRILEVVGQLVKTVTNPHDIVPDKLPFALLLLLHF
jgi:hypothetical protein